MSSLTFEEIVRNLLVYLKGQIPSMNSKTNKEEIVRQLQSIAFTLRTSIVQLEAASFQDPTTSKEFLKLKEDFTSLQATNTRLEESLFLEMNKTKNLTEEIAILEKNDSLKDQEIKNLNKEIENLKNQLAKHGNNVSDEELTILKDKIEELENELIQSRNHISDLKQALQNKEIELSKAKESLLKAIELDKSEIEALQKKLQENEKYVEKIKALTEQVESLKKQLKNSSSDEIYLNKIAAAEAKIKFLTQTIENLKQQANIIDPEELEMLKNEKNELEQRVIDLETALRKTIKQKENLTNNNIATLRVEESVLLFDTLFSTVKRLQQSPENKDIFQKAQKGLAILEKNNAVKRIATLGELYDSNKHRVIKSFKNDFLEDETIVYEVSPGFSSGSLIIQKAVVYISKSKFICSDCGHKCKEMEYFCPKCGLELSTPDGTSKKDLQPMPRSVEFNLPLINALIKKQSYTLANALVAYVAREHPDNPDIVKIQQNLLIQNSPTYTYDNFKII